MKLFFKNHFRDESDQAVIDTLLRKGFLPAPPEPDLQPGELAQWDSENQAWQVVPAAVPEPVWSSLDFPLRFTADERMAFIEAAKTDLVVADFRHLCAAAGTVRADNPITQQGLGYLVSQNLLTAERAAEVLNPAWNPS